MSDREQKRGLQDEIQYLSTVVIAAYCLIRILSVIHRQRQLNKMWKIKSRSYEEDEF